MTIQKKAKKEKVTYENFTPEKVHELDQEMLAIESTMWLEGITLKKLRWQVRMTVKTILPRSYRAYKVELELDESPYLERIEELERDFDASLFANDKTEKKKHHENIKEMREQLSKLQEETEYIKFTATVDELKYKANETSLLMNIPDDVIEAFNRQKTRFDIYKVTLTPII